MIMLTEHLATPTPHRDLDWIREALQSAVALECATLPLYLSAMFSLEVQNYTTYNLIRGVVMEEMVHMAIAGNALAALGGSPAIKGLNLKFPARGLPGGAEPDLYVGCAPLSKRQLKAFLRIEMPAFLLPPAYQDEKYPTIAGLYQAIRDAIRGNADGVRAAVKAGGKANQVGDNIGFTAIVYTPDKDPVKQIDAAIVEILQQGEGSKASDLFAEGSQGEPSHYLKFAELYYGAEYAAVDGATLTRDNQAKFFTGRPIPWPVVQNTLAVPSDGYAALLALDPNADQVKKDLDAFDEAFTGILAGLDAVWNGPAAAWWPTLGKAVDAMTSLRVLSCFNLMRHAVPADAVAKLEGLYPAELAYLRDHTDLSKPVYYGPRFINQNAS